MTTTPGTLLASASHPELAGFGAALIGLSLALIIFGIVFWQKKMSRGKVVPAAAHTAGKRAAIIGVVLLVVSIVLVMIGAS
jgi:uncharacterized membrane protein YidH (DUF202 family)